MKKCSHIEITLFLTSCSPLKKIPGEYRTLEPDLEIDLKPHYSFKYFQELTEPLFIHEGHGYPQVIHYTDRSSHSGPEFNDFKVCEGGPYSNIQVYGYYRWSNWSSYAI